MIETVLFDLFETLITESKVRPTRAGSIGPTLGLEQEAYRAEWKARRPHIVVGELSFVDALIEICEALVGSADLAAIQRIRQQRLEEKAAAYAHEDGRITALVSELSRRGVRLGVVSNAFEEDVSAWPSCRFASAFQCRAFSCEEGIAKPNPEIYLRVVDRLEAKPETTVYIGDGGDDELKGAEDAGLRPYRASWFYRRPGQSLAWPEVAGASDVLHLVGAS